MQDLIKYGLIITAASVVFCFAVMIIYALTKNRVRERERIKALTTPEEETRHREKKGKKPRAQRKQLEKLADELYVAGIALRAEEFILIWVIATVGVPLLFLFFGANPILCIGVVIIGAAAPIAFVRFKRHKQLGKIDKQLIDAVAIISNSIRAGMSFQSAMQSIADEMEPPISKEFARVSRETRLGMPLETSFEQMITRTGNMDLELICNAVIIQRQIGGNLAEVLDNISATIADRIRLRGEIKAMTASGTLSGYIIGALPIFMLLLLMFLNPEYINMFFSTSAGRVMLAISATMETIGFLIVRKIVNIKM
ncbi:MAG TPA: type II secretion system F family protein [Oscillospiraceae bacterium]|nr:type II secretion system F family protein [Oscillospiraceae bacterium]HPF55305.1 type II secretion system F family protein [Clostridiales bacterium]HPK34708.1 type II secretion system F family protein [Oscillospiraceae bacterium]HPR74528.1 type II secretion system F family protein [Oscillospiraceae bacterium]